MSGSGRIRTSKAEAVDLQSTEPPVAQHYHTRKREGSNLQPPAGRLLSKQLPNHSVRFQLKRKMKDSNPRVLSDHLLSRQRR